MRLYCGSIGDMLAGVSAEVFRGQGGAWGVLVCGNTYAAVVRVKRLAPCLHDEGVVDGDDEDFAGGLGLLALDVAGDVGLGAAGACACHKIVSLMPLASLNFLRRCEIGMRWCGETIEIIVGVWGREDGGWEV